MPSPHTQKKQQNKKKTPSERSNWFSKWLQTASTPRKCSSFSGWCLFLPPPHLLYCLATLSNSLLTVALSFTNLNGMESCFYSSFSLSRSLQTMHLRLHVGLWLLVCVCVFPSLFATVSYTFSGKKTSISNRLLIHYSVLCCILQVSLRQMFIDWNASCRSFSQILPFHLVFEGVDETTSRGEWWEMSSAYAKRAGHSVQCWCGRRNFFFPPLFPPF